MTKTTEKLKRLILKSVNTDNSGNHHQTKENCWDLVGNILHGVEIDIFKDVGKYKSANIIEAIENTDEIDAAFSVKSDKYARKMFSSIDFLRCVNQFLEDAEEVLSENKIFVGSLYG